MSYNTLVQLLDVIFTSEAIQITTVTFSENIIQIWDTDNNIYTMKDFVYGSPMYVAIDNLETFVFGWLDYGEGRTWWFDNYKQAVLS